MRLGFDVDGVLANFEGGFLPLLPKQCQDTAERVFVDGEPTVWDWPQQVGATPRDIEKAWFDVYTNPSFWRNLKPINGAQEALRRLCVLRDQKEFDIYFVTARSGRRAKLQTEDWLAEHGMPRATVLMTSLKADIADALGLDAYIDDNPDTIRYWNEKATLFVKDRPFNRTHYHWAVRVPSVGAMLDHLGL